MGLQGREDRSEFLDQPNKMSRLTLEETAIMGLIARGMKDSRICIDMDMSYAKYRKMVAHILQKLEVESKLQAAVMYTEEQTRREQWKAGTHWNSPEKWREVE